MADARYSLRLMEVFRTVFYTPIHVAVAGGFLESEGLDVSFSSCPANLGSVPNALNQGVADISGSGVMRSIIESDSGAQTVLPHFAEINSRDGFFVLGRESGDGFRWDSLSGATVIPVGFSAMPWASFQFALRKNGVDPQSLTLIPDLSLPDAVAAFKSGQGDFIHLPEPAAEQLIADGAASLSVALGPVNGHIAYSSFAATEAYLERNTETVHRFIRGYARGLTWLRESDPATVGDAVSGFFPDVPSELITKSVARYKEQGTWPATPHLEQPEFEGLQEILMGAGMVKEHQPYAKIVRPELVREALA